MRNFYLFPPYLMYFFLASFVVMLTSCSDSNNKHKRPRSQLVSISHAIISPMKSVSRLPATLEAFQEVEIVNQEEGLILSLPFHQGDKVTKDQIIVELESKLIQAELNKALISLRQAKLELKRLKQLRKKRLSTEEALTLAKTKLELTQAEKTVLQTRFEYAQIKSPFDGVVTQRFKEPGNVIAKYNTILTVADISKLKAKVYISELLLPNIKIGTAVSIQIDALGSTEYPAIISRVYPAIDQGSNQGIFEILIESPPTDAQPGQLSHIIINNKTSPRLNIPLAAIKHNINGAYVYAIKDKKAVITKVKTGVQVGNNIEILEGLSENDKVVIKGFVGLTNNKKIKLHKDKITSENKSKP